MKTKTGRRRVARQRLVMMPRKQFAAIERVLALVDAYLEAQNPDTLTAGGGGMMTWGELRAHVQKARELALYAVTQP